MQVTKERAIEQCSEQGSPSETEVLSSIPSYKDEERQPPTTTAGDR